MVKDPAVRACEGRNHYSYTTYADPETARTFDARRFGGPIGDLVASTQARVLANLIGPIRDRVILDVGTGTGRAALLLARGGANVTAVDASERDAGGRPPPRHGGRGAGPVSGGGRARARFSRSQLRRGASAFA